MRFVIFGGGGPLEKSCLLYTSSELCRQLLSYGPAKLVCVDQAETPLFYLQHATSDSKVEKAYCVADITDRVRMREILEQQHVRAIFHAAAYKHVPLMEHNLQAVSYTHLWGISVHSLFVRTRSSPRAVKAVYL